MTTERDFENVLAKYPELIEDGLRLTGRQIVVDGRRLDLLFEDQLNRRMVVELKWGPIKDQDIGQIMSYEGSLISTGKPDLRVMLIGTRVPPNMRRVLDHHGIAWKEIQHADILAFLRARSDCELLPAFDDSVADSRELCVRSKEVYVQTPQANSMRARIGDAPNHRPALWVPLTREVLQQAFDAFERGRSEIYYGTNGQIGAARKLAIQYVYFKIKKQPEVVAKADLIEVTTFNQPNKRISLQAAREEYRFYYGFRNLKRLKSPVPLSVLRRFNQERGPVLFTAQSPCLIEEISIL